MNTPNNTKVRPEKPLLTMYNSQRMGSLNQLCLLPKRPEMRNYIGKYLSNFSETFKMSSCYCHKFEAGIQRYCRPKVEMRN